MRVNNRILVIIGIFSLMLLVCGCSCEHEYGEWSVVSPSTCTTEGTEERTCSKCEEKETRSTVILPHSFGEWEVVTSPTCVETGLECQACSICGTVQNKDIPKLSEHSYDGWTVVKESTCTENGRRQQTCIYCNNINAETIPVISHNWTVATCTTAKNCSVCGKTEGNPINHNWAPATCTTAKKCRICWETEGVALGHNWASATCQKPKTCKNCGATTGTTLDHNWNPTTRVCSTCEEKLVFPIIIGPSNLTGGENSISLSWEIYPDTVDGYEVYQSTEEYGHYEKVATTTANVRTVTITGLEEATTYYYKVRAFIVSNGTYFYGDFTGVRGATTKSSQKFSIELPDLPLSFSWYMFDGEIYSTASLTDIRYSTSRNHDGTIQVKFYFSGEKTANGTGNIYAVRGNWALIEKDTGLVVDTGYIKKDGLKVGEKFSNIEALAGLQYGSGGLKEIPYILEIYDN